MDVNRLAIDDGTPGGPLAVDRLPLPNDRNRSVLRLEHQLVAVFQHDQCVGGLTKLTGTLDDGPEDRRDVGRRGRDHAEDAAAPGLVRQRFLQLTGLGLYLVEQSRILDGDDGLVGEGLDER